MELDGLVVFGMVVFGADITNGVGSYLGVALAGLALDPLASLASLALGSTKSLPQSSLGEG